MQIEPSIQVYRDAIEGALYGIHRGAIGKPIPSSLSEKISYYMYSYEY